MQSGTLILTQNSVHKDTITAVKWLPDHQGFVTSSHDMSLIYWVCTLSYLGRVG